MKRLLLLLLACPMLASAQNFHLSARFGIANYQGDLKAKSFSFSKSKMLFSLGARYDLTEHLVARSYISMTSLQAHDKDGTASMKLRNLSFKSKILEWEVSP